MAGTNRPKVHLRFVYQTSSNFHTDPLKATPPVFTLIKKGQLDIPYQTIRLACIKYKEELLYDCF